MCVSDRLHAATLQISQGKWLTFYIIPQFHFHKTCLPVVSKLCKFIPRTKATIPVCWLWDLFLACSAKSVLSENFPERNRKQHFSLRKQKYLKLDIKKGKMHQCVSRQVGDCKYSGFVRRKCWFLFRHRVLCSEKYFPTGSELCKGRPRSHCTIPLKKNSEKNVLWGLLLYLLLPRVVEITLSDDFVALISKDLCFQKTQIPKQSYGLKGERNELVCIYFRHQSATTSSHTKKCCFCL